MEHHSELPSHLPHHLLPLLPLLLPLLLLPGASGHGRLVEPPSRSTMWRYGFDTPANYNDHEGYCGGFTRQWQTNGGKCGICGDPWDEPQPRSNEAGGRFGRGVITRKYSKNQAIKVKVELTANHMGHFEFKVCPNNSPAKPASQACLDRYLLVQANGEGPNYHPGPGNKVFESTYQLPKDLTCQQCVFQWRYVAANNWGTCKNGTGKVGCGPQEEFRACSDVTITEEDGEADRTPNKDQDVFTEDEEDNIIGQEADWEPFYHPDLPSQQQGGERMAVIVLASLLTAVLMFGAVFLYYYRVRDSARTFLKERDLSLPSLPSMPSIRPVKTFCKLDKLGKINWPLSNIKLGTKLPSFITRSPVLSLSPSPTPSSPPIPPPRLKRNKSQSPDPPGPRLATISARPHPRPPAPPPPAPPILEISAPTEVTINGVTVSTNSPMGHTADSGPTPSSRGVICGGGSLHPPPLPTVSGGKLPPPPPSSAPSRPPPPPSSAPPRHPSSVYSDILLSRSPSPGGLCEARPVLVLADQPDSSLEPSSSLPHAPLPPSFLFPPSPVPPPLPSCPPPDSMHLATTKSSTEA